jgi:hypothetical protein
MPLSHQTADARAFPAATAESLWRQIPVPHIIAAAGLSTILAIASVDAALRGPWLDEFWTLELSDNRNGLLALMRDGWMRDTHPPGFNAWATLLASLGVTSISAGRLVSNLLAAGLMILAARRLSRRMPEQAGFNAVLLLLTLSLPHTMESFATYRSYFWQIAAIGTLVLVARYIASARVDLDWRKDVDLAAIAAIATVASIGLHYVGGLFGGLLSGMIALSAYGRGLRRWSAMMLAAAALAALFIFASVLLQASNWATDFDHNWIDLPGIKALGIPVALAVTAICYNPVPLAGLWLIKNRRSEWERGFITIIGGALVAGIAIILTVHAFRPIVVERYLIAVPVLVGALMAVPAARLVQAYPLLGLLALVSVAIAAAPMVRDGVKPLWREDAQTIAKIVADCPTTQVYAASGWALGPAAETRTAHREDPVFERAYRLLASRHGYEVHFISLGGTAHAAPGSCPVVLWYEHTPNQAEDDLPAAVDDAGLTGLHGARLSVFRSATGFVVRADRP